MCVCVSCGAETSHVRARSDRAGSDLSHSQNACARRMLGERRGRVCVSKLCVLRAINFLNDKKRRGPRDRGRAEDAVRCHTCQELLPHGAILGVRKWRSDAWAFASERPPP